MKKLTLLTAIFMIACTAAAQWEWQNPLPQGNSIVGISFIDENNGWAVGVSGTIIHTTDGGLTWEIQDSGISGIGIGNTLEDIYFTDLLNGWAVGTSGGHHIILHTEDGGNKWSPQMGGARLPSSLTGVWFVDQQTGWAVGWEAVIHDGPMILYTTNGGDTWKYQNYDLAFSVTGTHSVCFINHMEGWIAWGSNIIHTIDGGVTWEAQNSNTTNSLDDIFFIDTDHGWAAGKEGTVLITSNGGEMWESSIDSSLSGTYLRDVSFINADTGWVGGYYKDNTKRGIILKTTDGGFTWENQLIDPELKSIYCLTYKNESEGFAAGANGEMLKAFNGGNNWGKISSSVTTCDFKDVLFIDQNKGWATGGLDSGDVCKPAIFNTCDGGINWIEQEIPLTENNYLYEIFFTDSQHGWALGSAAQLICTTNGGENWELQSTEDISGDIYFISPSLGWRVGKNGAIQKTEDGGWNWEDQTSGFDKQLNSVFFIDDNRGWVVGDSIILHTVNSGEIWEEQLTGIFPWSDIYFIDQQHGWVVGRINYIYGGSEGKIMQTTDGGNAWVEIEGIYFQGLSQIYFADIQNGWAFSSPGSGSMSKIFRTQDGGLTWNAQSLPALVYGFCFVDENNGWTVGDNGTILYTNNGGASGFENINIENSKLNIQTFPNPFPNSTTIEWELTKPEDVKITVFNHLGQQIEKVVQRNYPSGKQQYVWNAAGLPDGLYFVQLRAGQKMVSKKIVKMRR